ncbi:MAG: hypothetical protein WC935_07175 [Thermoleophilia bacterium]
MEQFYEELRHSFSAGIEMEPIESIVAAQGHRDFWRPAHVRLILLAESHIFTAGKEAERVVRTNPAIPADVPTGFARLVYCLGYGENELLDEPIAAPRNGACPEFWKIFNACTAAGADPASDGRVLRSRTRQTARLRAKVGILRELQATGVWLLDASLTAVYSPGGGRLSDGLIKTAIELSWRHHVRAFVQNASPEGVLVIGHGVWNIVSPWLRDLGIPVGATFQPGAWRTREQRIAARARLRRCVENPLAVRTPPVVVDRPVQRHPLQGNRMTLTGEWRNGMPEAHTITGASPPQYTDDLPGNVYVRRSREGRLQLSEGLVDLLRSSRDNYAWPFANTTAQSQQEIIDIERSVGEWMNRLSVETAHQIVIRVSKWAGNRRHKSVVNADDGAKGEMFEAVRLLAGEDTLSAGLDKLSKVRGISLVIATKVYRFCAPRVGAAVDRHASYFFNSLRLMSGNASPARSTHFRREWVDGRHRKSRLATFSPAVFIANRTKYTASYLPLLGEIGSALDSAGVQLTCAALGGQRTWTPADVEMAAFYWWAQNGSK